MRLVVGRREHSCINTGYNLQTPPPGPAGRGPGIRPSVARVGSKLNACFALRHSRKAVSKAVSKPVSRPPTDWGSACWPPVGHLLATMPTT